MKRRTIALAVVVLAAAAASLFFAPIIPVWLPPMSPSHCDSILCVTLNAHGYGSVSYVWFGVGGTFYSPDHFRVLGASF
jgi:hypothetical protein